MKFKAFLIVLIWVIGLADGILASRALFLEANPIFASLGIGFGVIFAMKIVMLLLFTFWIVKNTYRHEKQIFHFATTLMLLIFLWGFGAGSGIYGNINYQQGEDYVIDEINKTFIEERGVPITEIEKQETIENIQEELAIETARVAMPYYIKIVWIVGILPYIFANLSFYVYRKLKLTAKIVPKNEKK